LPLPVIHGVTSYSIQIPLAIAPLSSREALMAGFVAQVIPVSLQVVLVQSETGGPFVAGSTTQRRSTALWAGPERPVTLKRR
jgi:hypothetical protein